MSEMTLIIKVNHQYQNLGHIGGMEACEKLADQFKMTQEQKETLEDIGHVVLRNGNYIEVYYE